LINIVSLTRGRGSDVGGGGGEGLEESEKEKLRGVVERLEREGIDLEELGLAKTEWEEFKARLQ
jgi:hypothetical protein